MKVLFAVSNEEISESIVKKYQKDYKQIISYKNVYYFNAILKELQKDKTYDRVVISEDLEAFTHTQYDQIDKFIFDKLDSISDEASNINGNDIPIIMICSDRRAKSEEMLVKLFGIGIYNAIIGTDRSVDTVCKLINRPRSKKEAKIYYNIEAEDVNYQSENENDVSEMEIQNILAHYKRLGKDEERYVESFNNIAAQYNDIQLRIISKFLPLNVRAVLEEKSLKYQEIMSFNNTVSNSLRSESNVNKAKEQGPSEKLLKMDTKIKPMANPVVIPSSVNMNSTKKLSRSKLQEEKDGMINLENEEPTNDTEIQETIVEPVKRGRGRPRKNPNLNEQKDEETLVKRGRGRPRKNQSTSDVITSHISETPIEKDEMTLPGIEEVISTPTNTEEIQNQNSSILPGIEQSSSVGNFLPGFGANNEINTVNANIEHNPVDLSYLMSPDKKIVTFVGTSKNGTSFIVNTLAQLLSSAGINTAILDTTKNRNSYYIYTKNEENLRKIATNCIDNLAKGEANGIPVNNNLTVYTSLPNENNTIEQVDEILETLLTKHSLILIDTDFETPSGYFKQSQETYLIQTLDVLTIQPLTAFLRNLKAKNILDENKLRIILNKTVKIRGVNDKTIIGGMAYYNDPAMSFMTELFNRDLIKYISVPFEEETYIKYLENIIECDISLKGYSKVFMQTLKELGNMVYPMINNKYNPPSANRFSSNMNNTLNQMRNNY